MISPTLDRGFWLVANETIPSHPIPSQYNCYQMKICCYECLLNNIGEKLGKLPAVFSTMYLSGGTCVLSIITGEKTLEYPYQVLCGDDFECNSRSLRGTQWFLVFISLAILVAQFFANMDSVALISLTGSIKAVVYCSSPPIISTNL